MEQRLAEFREARKRAGLAAPLSASGQDEQGAGEKAEEAAATPKAAPGRLRRFLDWKPRPARAPARPAQEAANQLPGSTAVPPPRPVPVLPDQHHLLEGSSLVGPAGSVCGTGIWPCLFCPVHVLLDVRGDPGSRGEKGRREERLLSLQPGLRSHPGHPHCGAAGAGITAQAPAGEIGPGSTATQSLSMDSRGQRTAAGVAL